MADHVKILAILHIVFGALSLLAALLILVIFGGVAGIVSVSDASHDPNAYLAVPVLGVVGTVIFGLLLLLSLPGVLAGVGLLKFQPWARILTIVLCALNLLNVPFGTALGIYGLWVLLNSETERLFAARRV
jgi:hypothetical protein